MIKSLVRSGFSAVRRLIAEGVNVNITTLFSAADCEAAARAYMEGLHERAAWGRTSDTSRRWRASS